MSWEKEINRANRHLPDEFMFPDILTGVPIVAERIEGWWTGITFDNGPEDEADPAVNGDIDSTAGEEDESGFHAGEGDGYEEFLDDEEEEGEDDGEESEDGD